MEKLIGNFDCVVASFIALLLVTTPTAFAQREPQIGYVYPAGGQQGTTFEVLVGGQYLSGLNGVYVSGTGVRVDRFEVEKIINAKEATELRDRLQELRKQNKTAEILKEMLEIGRKLALFNQRRQTPPAIADKVTIQITIAPDATPGDRELRVRTPAGLSNPLVFQVGQLPEFSEPTPKLDDAELLRQFQAARGGNPPPKPPELPITIMLPATVNGQILPGGVDRFRFPAQRGQQLVVTVNARQLIPYLADAVPGWFQAVVTIKDANGKELAFNDDYRFSPDPVLFCEIPADGEYVLEIRDSIYRGREDFVYRISVGELPFVESIFPLGGRAGAQTSVEIRGHHLPITKQPLDLRGKQRGIHPFFVNDGKYLSNTVPFAVDTLPEIMESEPNDSVTRAQTVALPVIVNGRIASAGDVDIFRFQGRAGDRIVTEVMARRLDSPLDSALRLTDAAGKQIAFNDDHEDKASGLNTHHADSYLIVTLPSDGTYYLYLSDTQRKGGSAYAYRLRISPPQPDFELRVVPSGIGCRAGMNVPLTVHALRKDGFDGEIELSLKDAPEGFKIDGAQIPAYQNKVQITLNAPPTGRGEPFNLQLEGRATAGGREIVRRVVPADDRMQAFAYRHLVPAQELKTIVAGRFAGPSPKILSALPIKIPAGDAARVQVTAPAGLVVENLSVELIDPPEGISIKSMTHQRERAEFLVQTDAAKVKPGLQGNLIVRVIGERVTPPNEKQPQGNRQRLPLGVLPAIPFEVVER